MRATFAIASVLGHASATRAHAFPNHWRTRKRSRIHVSRQKLEGNVRILQASSVGQSPTKPHVLVLLNQAFTLPLVLMFSCLNI